MVKTLYWVTRNGMTRIVEASELEFEHIVLEPDESMNVVTRERHAFIKVTEKYPTGAPSLRSFEDFCGMEDCGLPSTDPVHF